MPPDNAISNHLTIDALLVGAPIPASTSTEELAMLVDDLAVRKKALDRVSGVIHAACDHKFASKAQAARVSQNKDTGTIRLTDGDFEIVINAPKRVEWDEKQLKVLYDRIVHMKDDPAEYIDVTYSVQEKRYEAWPEMIRRQFTPARTVKIGKVIYGFEKKSGS